MSNHELPPEVDVETVIELSDAFPMVVADERRTRILSVLSSDRDDWTLESLAAAVDHAPPERRTESEPSKRITAALHHVHLPKLADFGLVEYDPDRLEASVTAKGARCVELCSEMRAV